MEVRQEEDRVPGGKVMVIAGIVVVVSAIYILAALGIETCGPKGPLPGAYGQDVPQEVNAMELTLFDTELPSEIAVRQERAYLDSFGWIDPEAGIARVPIDVAIDLYLAERGVQAEGGDSAEVLR
jgi:hypothetical protein